jgi:enoyl-[acyl-carrier protein] reductase I
MQDLMKGKRGLIMGVANDHSIAWGIAKTLAAQGAELAFTYQGEALGKRVKPLAQSLGVDTVLPCDVENLDSVDQVFAALRAKWGQLDFLVHAIAFSDKNELKGRYADTTRENFSRTMLIASVRYLASDFGSRGIRVNAISAGPVRTLAGSGIGDARAMFAFQQKHSPLGRGVTLDELGGSALYLLSDLSGGVTGEVHYVDSGYNVISMPRPEELKAE